MEPKALINADYLDIIFNNRNKSYGGYELRRNYNNRVKKAAGFMLLGLGAILCFSFIAGRHHMIDTKPRLTPTIISEIVTVVPPKVIPRVLPPVQPPPPHLNSRMFTRPEIVDDPLVPDDKQMTQNKDLEHAQPGFSNSIGDSIDIAPVNAPGSGTGVIPAPADKPNVPVRWVEQMPQFRGDMESYIASHIHYPDAARNEGIQGHVMVEFVVNEDGTVTNVKVLRGIGGGCDEEAMHMVSGMPSWKPGKQNGRPVKVLFTLPITFVLN